MSKNKQTSLQKAVKLTLGLAAGAAGAAAVVAIVGLHRWAKDPYSKELSLHCCGKRTLRLTKGEPGKYVLDLSSPARDPEVAEEETREHEPVLEIKLDPEMLRQDDEADKADEPEPAPEHEPEQGADES